MDRLTVGNQLRHLFQVGRIYQTRFSKIPLPLCTFFGEDMTRKGLVPHNLTRTRGLKPLGRTTVCLDLWHLLPPYTVITFITPQIPLIYLRKPCSPLPCPVEHPACAPFKEQTPMGTDFCIHNSLFSIQYHLCPDTG